MSGDAPVLRVVVRTLEIVEARTDHNGAGALPIRRQSRNPRQLGEGEVHLRPDAAVADVAHGAHEIGLEERAVRMLAGAPGGHMGREW